MPWTYQGRRLRWTQSTREHRIGRASAVYVMERVEPFLVPARPGERDPRWWWIADDERGRELEVAAVDLLDGSLLVLHLFPTALRRPSRPEED